VLTPSRCIDHRALDSALDLIEARVQDETYILPVLRETLEAEVVILHLWSADLPLRECKTAEEVVTSVLIQAVSLPVVKREERRREK